MRAPSLWLAAGLTLAVLAAVPILVFSPALPPWMATAATVFLVLAFLARALLTGHLLGHTPADWPLLALLLLLPVGLWASPDPAITYPRTDALLASAALFWVVAAQRDRPWLRYSDWALLLGGLAAALIVIAGTQFPAKLPFVPVDIIRLAQARLNVPWLRAEEFNPNLSGHLLALFLAPAVGIALAGNGRTQRLAALAVSVLLSGLLVLSQSRGALLGALAAIIVLTVLTDRRWLALWAPLALAGLGAALAWGDRLNIETLIAGGSSGVVSTVQGRLELWSRALYLMEDFPFTGVGLGMPEPVIKLLYPLFLAGPDTVWMHVHNTFLQIGSEMGIPGLIAFVAMLLAVAAALVQQSSNPRAGIYQGLSLALLGSLIVFVVHSLVDAPLVFAKIAVIFFGLLGLMAAVATSEQRTGD